MSGAVVGVLEIAVGAVLEIASAGAATPFVATLYAGLYAAGASTLLGFAVSLLTDPRKAPLIPIGASYSGTLELPAVAQRTTEEVCAAYLATKV